MLLKFHGKNFLRLFEASSINFGLKADTGTQEKKQGLAPT